MVFINKIVAKFEIKKFNWSNFSLWKIKIRAILIKYNCLKAIEEKPAWITDDKYNEMDGNVIAGLYLALTDEVLPSVVEKNKQQKAFRIHSQNCMRLSHYITRSS